MSLLEVVHGYGATGAKPAATAATEGYLYFDTTLSRMERSNGSSWDVVDPQRAFGQSTITSQTTEGAGTFTDITGASVTLTTVARRLRVALSVWCDNDTNGGGAIQLLIDGAAISANPEINFSSASGDNKDTRHVTLLTAVVTAASHTIKAQGKRATGSGDAHFGHASYVGYLLVEETEYTT